MEWGWPQWTMAVMYGVSVFGAGLLHDKPRTGKHNGLASALAILAYITILHFGGFW